MNAINLLSYNLNFHAAYPELTTLTQTHMPALVCLQECDTSNISPAIANLTLAAKTTTGTLGLAIYCDNDTFRVIRSESIPLRLSAYERIATQDRERLLVVELYDCVRKTTFWVASFHATHLIATNALRRQQLTDALSALSARSHGHPVVLVGDFNYPFFHDRLRRSAKIHNYTLHTTNSPTFHGRNFRGRFDMATTSRIHATIKTLPFGLSDHTPILMQLQFINSPNPINTMASIAVT